MFACEHVHVLCSCSSPCSEIPTHYWRTVNPSAQSYTNHRAQECGRSNHNTNDKPHKGHKSKHSYIKSGSEVSNLHLWLWSKLLPRAGENVHSENRLHLTVTLLQKIPLQTPRFFTFVHTKCSCFKQGECDDFQAETIHWCSCSQGAGKEFKLSRWWWWLFSMNTTLKCQQQMPLQDSSPRSQRCTRWVTLHTHTHTLYWFQSSEAQTPSPWWLT